MMSGDEGAPQSTYIYRVPQYSSPRRNRDSPNPSPASPHSNQRVGGHTRLRVGGGGVPIPTTGEKA